MVLAPGLLAQQADYTDKDFDALRLRLQSVIRSVFPDWTDYNVANFGNLLIEAFAFVGDVLTFYQDNQALETRWVTATQRRSLIHLTRIIGFEPTTNAAATVSLEMTITGAVGRVFFTAGDVIASTEEVTDPVRFQLLADLVFDPNVDTSPITVTFEHSETEEELFGATGLPFQEISLAKTPYIDGSAVVAAQNGTYTEVEDFLSSEATDRVFKVEVDQNDRAFLIFPDGINGALPSGTISVTYKFGGGATGNVEQGTVKKLEQSFADEFGNPVTITVTNPAKASGGDDRQTVAQIREAAPLSIRAINRSVSREDFEINALRLAGVARALMLTSNEDAIPENTGILFVIPVGGGLPTPALKAEVLNQVTVVYPSTLTFTTLVQDPVYLTIDIAATVFLKQGQDETDAREEIEGLLEDFFALENDDGTMNEKVDWGFNLKDADGEPSGEIAWSDLFNVVRDASSVRKIRADDFTLNGSRVDVPIAAREFPILGTISLINGDTGLPL